MATFQTLPGFREFYPEDFARRNHIFRLWRQTAHTFGFAEYDAPVLEPLELYKAKSETKSKRSFSASPTRAGVKSRCDRR